MNYLPQCGLWSRLLLGNLNRHSTSYNIKENPFKIGVRYLNTNENTNAQVEVLFKIKKLVSFKGRTGLRVDKFIEENWKDNLGIQRDFVNQLICSSDALFKRTVEKVKAGKCRRTAKHKD